MNLKVIQQLNSTTRLEVEFNDERDLKEAILKATPFLQLPHKCGKCQSPNITFGGRLAKSEKGEFVYVEVYCYDCRAKRPFGEYQNPKGAIFMKKWEEPYVKDGRIEEPVTD